MGIDINQFFKNLVDKENGRPIPLHEFPSLFTMEAHSGFFGAIFSFAWFFNIFIGYPKLWQGVGSSSLIGLAVAIFLAFIVLAWVPVLLSDYFSGKISDLKNNTADEVSERAKLDARVRVGILCLSASFVIICSLLIWSTGGATSPFIPFYVMTFTLTIEKNKVPYPGFWVLGAFLFAILIACLAAEFLHSPIDKAVLAEIQQSGFQTTVHIAFLCASLVVPTLSKYFLELRARRPKQTAG